MFSMYIRFVERIAAQSVDPRLTKRIVHFVTAFALLVSAVVIYFLDWSWYALALATLFGASYGTRSWYAERKARKQNESSSSQKSKTAVSTNDETDGISDQTTEIPITVPHGETQASEQTDNAPATPLQVPRREARKIKPYQIIQHNGKTWYVVNQREVFKDHFWSKGKVYITTRKVEVVANEVTNPKLLKKVRYIPGEGTKCVYVCDRLHWIEHAPLQILSYVLGIAAVLAYLVFFPILMEDMLYMAAASILLCTVSVALTALFFREWIPWAYTALIVDDRRLHLKFAPPLWLVGENKDARVEQFQDVKALDQPNGSKWLPALSNFLTTLRVAGYKILFASTAGQRDEWIEDGIRYVRHGDTVKQIINDIIDSGEYREEQRHIEDMEIQRRQMEVAERAARAAEEMRDLMLRNPNSS